MTAAIDELMPSFLNRATSEEAWKDWLEMVDTVSEKYDIPISTLKDRFGKYYGKTVYQKGWYNILFRSSIDEFLKLDF